VSRGRASVPIALLLVVCALNAGAQPLASAKAAASLDAERLAQIGPVVEEAVAAHKLPGAVIVAGRGDRVEYRQAFGNRALVPSVEPMTLDTIFDLASLTKDGVDYTGTVPNATQSLTANLTADPGRSVTVADSSGFVVDASVIFSQSLTQDDWVYSKVRKIPDATHVEVYHGVTGLTTVYPAKIRQFDASRNRTPPRSILTSFGAAFGAIQHIPRIVPGLPEVMHLPRPAQQQVVSSVQFYQEMGGLVGRFILAFLAVRIVSRRRLLRVFQVPGLFLVPLVFLYPAVHDLETLKWGIFLAGLLTVAQFSFWGNYLPRVYPTHLRGTGESFAASRLTRGNLFFPTRIVVTPLHVSRVKPHLFRSTEESIAIAQVASVGIETGIIWAEIRIDSTGGADPITSHGHRKHDAVRIRELIEGYQAGRAVGK
jgi:hypothetical protein